MVSDFFKPFLYCWVSLLQQPSLTLGEGNGTPLQYSCLENPMDGGAWWAAVHGVAKSWIRLSDFTFTFLHWRRKWQCSCLENPRDGVAQSWTRLKRLGRRHARSIFNARNLHKVLQISVNRWIKKMWYLYIMEYYSVIKLLVDVWMDLQTAIQSEVSQKNIY